MKNNTFSPKECALYLENITSGPMPANPPTTDLSKISGQIVRVLEAQPSLKKPYLVFMKASTEVLPPTINEARWEALQMAAKKLAAELRSLSVRHIILCQAKTQYGMCGHGLNSRGNCPVAHKHA